MMFKDLEILVVPIMQWDRQTDTTKYIISLLHNSTQFGSEKIC